MTSATGSAGLLTRRVRLLGQALVYEVRKLTAFRTGFVVREFLGGIAQPVVMIFVYAAIFRANEVPGGEATTLRGFTFVDLVHYLILVAVFDKILFHMRALDLSEQIFQGYVTKYLVMPFRYFTLALGRWLQHVGLQLLLTAAMWFVGRALIPDWWPAAASGTALAQALVLIVLGSYCFFLTYFIVNALAFWLDVVWTLLLIVGFVSTFIRGVLIPVSIMPQVLQDAFAWLFPYWALSAPIEIVLGRAGTDTFLRGLGVLLVSAVLLEVTRQFTWRRGTCRYTGSGM